MSFNRADFGLEATITKKSRQPNQNSAFANAKREQSVKTFTLYYPLCYEVLDQFLDSSSNELIILGDLSISLDMFSN